MILVLWVLGSVLISAAAILAIDPLTRMTDNADISAWPADHMVRSHRTRPRHCYRRDSDERGRL